MPILDVQIVSDDHANSEHWAQQIADAAAAAFRVGEGSVWVKLQFIEPRHYAENQVPRFSTPKPVFVSLTCFQLPEKVELEAQMRMLAERIGSVVEVPSHWVHLKYEPPAAGRIGFGGEMPEA